ncbi:MAG: glycyl-radical enzyme activating protein, partial [Eubacterium sp.]|nr:glycyl-radical enzyme activating protein [Eubacterium sp.]
IRTPLIPGVNDSEEDLEKIGQFLSELPYVHHIQLLPYHRLGTDTYRKLGKEYLLKDVEVPPAEHMEWCRNVIKRYYDHVI